MYFLFFSFRLISLFSQGLLRRYNSLFQDTLCTSDSYSFYELWLVFEFLFRFCDDLPLFVLIRLIFAGTVAGAVAVTVTVDGSIEKREREKHTL